jgi:hypothetical protein
MVGASGPVRSGIIDHPMNATEGKGFYIQGGYYFSNWKVQPWANYEQWNATNALGRWNAFRVGLSYFLDGNNSNIKIGYERVNTEKDIGSSETLNSGKDSINTFMIGYYYSF